MNNIEILTDTLNIMSQGYYVKNGKKIDLKLMKSEKKILKEWKNIKKLLKY